MAGRLLLQAADYQRQVETTGDIRPMSAISDTARKLAVLRKHCNPQTIAGTNDHARGTDWFYDRIDTSSKGLGYGRRLATSAIDAEMVPQQLVDEALRLPDSGTRSSQRASFVNSQNPNMQYMYWSRASDTEGKTMQTWPDPYAAY